MKADGGKSSGQYRDICENHNGRSTPLNEPIKHDFYQFYIPQFPAQATLQDDVTNKCRYKSFDIAPNDADLRCFFDLSSPHPGH